MKFKVFYCFQSSGEEIAADDAVEMDLSDIQIKLLGGLKQQHDFIGLLDADGETLQVMYHLDKDEYWFEIPVEAFGGSYGSFLSLDDTVKLIKTLPEKFVRENFPSFKFESWDDDTLVDEQSPTR